MRAYGADLPVQAVHAFEFALYGPPLGPRDAVVGVSHRGTKRYLVLLRLRVLRLAGCTTALITGDAGTASVPEVDQVLHTVPQERSSAHTISYTGAVAALASLADQVGGHRQGRRPLGQAYLRTEIFMRCVRPLPRNPACRCWHVSHAGRRIWLVGGGPGAVVAHEIALKVKETSYLQAEGLSVEAMLHGPFRASILFEDLFVLIAQDGPSGARIAELAAPVRTIGAGLVIVGDDTTRAIDDGACLVPRVPEPFAGLTCVVPLQLFTYHLALVRGTNPDGFRLDDLRLRARTNRSRSRIPVPRPSADQPGPPAAPRAPNELPVQRGRLRQDGAAPRARQGHTRESCILNAIAEALNSALDVQRALERTRNGRGAPGTAHGLGVAPRRRYTLLQRGGAGSPAVPADPRADDGTLVLVSRRVPSRRS